MTSLEKLLKGEDLKPAEMQKLIALGDPELLSRLCQVLANQAKSARQSAAKAEAALEELRKPPWHPGMVVRVSHTGRLDVWAGGGRRIVAVLPELSLDSVKPGDEVFLNSDLTMAIGRNDEAEPIGLVGTVVEKTGHRVVLRAIGDEELVVVCPEHLAAGIKVGDRVLYSSEYPCLVERLPDRQDTSYVLAHPPDVSFDDIGGLDDLIAEVTHHLDLHLLHQARVGHFQLRLQRGMLLVGPPGVGKTMIAMAIARYLADHHANTRFLNVRPGELRSMYYGQTEARMRDLFAVAKAFQGLVVIFMDEFDHHGSRGAGIGQDLDGRVMGALLAEIEGLGSADNVLLIAGTNRLDLCDEALVRHGRLGDRIYHVRRPRRAGTRHILEKYLTPDLPYTEGGSRDALIEQAVSYLHAREGGAGVIATVTLRNSDRHDIRASHVLSGALLASAVERAKHTAAHRSLELGGGITSEDVLNALDEALTSEARKLNAPHVAQRVLDVPYAEHIVRVELPPERRLRRHRYLRVA